ncbi:MAG: alanine racemase [Chloroflexota bacterium]
MDPSRQHSTWVEIDLAAIEANARRLTKLTRAQLMAVLKANAYGHGAVEVARSAERGGATWVGVARADEAIELRKAGLAIPILVLGPAPSERLAELISNRVSLTVGDADQIRAAAAAARAQHAIANVHLKLDTGMNRLGAPPEAALDLAHLLQQEAAIHFEGLFTHFARADETEGEPIREQVERFELVLTALSGAGLRPPLVHAANSAATLTWPETHYDMVRVGILLYGLQPSPVVALPAGLLPAMQWKTQLTRVRSLPAGEGVSYGHDYVTQREERIGTVPVGYADGLRRVDANQVLVSGVRVPVVGRVCMDLRMLQLDHAPQAKPGDEVVLIGSQGQNRISAEQLAERWGTINYEVTCGIGARVPRIYV